PSHPPRLQRRRPHRSPVPGLDQEHHGPRPPGLPVEHEPCLYGWAEGAAHTWLSDRCQTTVLEFDKPARSADHPTMKPVELFAYLVRNSCPKGGQVLDPFGGSGTTLIAAEQEGRTAALLELDPRYCDVIVKRFETFTGQTA